MLENTTLGKNEIAMNLRVLITPAIVLSTFILPSPVFAQIRADNSTSTIVTTSNGRDFIISGGDKRGNNLFHSFEEFSIPTGGQADFFEFRPGVHNIFARITGDIASQIDGVVRTRNGANLFLINPRGIDFGINASLDIQGSFLASTAESIIFDDGTIFSADDTNPPLLTARVPIGLQMGATPTALSLAANAPNFELPANQDLVLVSHTITIDGGSSENLATTIQLSTFEPLSIIGMEVERQSITLDLSTNSSNEVDHQDSLDDNDQEPDDFSDDEGDSDRPSPTIENPSNSGESTDADDQHSSVPTSGSPQAENPQAENPSDYGESNDSDGVPIALPPEEEPPTSHNPTRDDVSQEFPAERPRESSESPSTGVAIIERDPQTELEEDPAENILLSVDFPEETQNAIALAFHSSTNLVVPPEQSEPSELQENIASSILLHGNEQQTIEPTCSPTAASSFVLVEHEGIPSDPRHTLGGEALWRDTRFFGLPATTEVTGSSPVSEVRLTSTSFNRIRSNRTRTEAEPMSQPLDRPETVIEAQGWLVNEEGNIVLIARQSREANHLSYASPRPCQTPSAMAQH